MKSYIHVITHMYRTIIQHYNLCDIVLLLELGIGDQNEIHDSEQFNTHPKYLQFASFNFYL